MADKEKSIGGIWERKTKKGDLFFSMTIEGKKYVAFTNRFTDNPKAPKWSVFADKPLPASMPQPSMSLDSEDVPF